MPTDFFVTAAGVQIDMKANISGYEDESWDAVWLSAVDINNHGWVAELEIPYSALRFPNKDIQNWGLNMARNIQRYRQNNSWNFINIGESGFTQQQGQLNGLKDITPPLRLSFFLMFLLIPRNMPQISHGRMHIIMYDLKYGINESLLWI